MKKIFYIFTSILLTILPLISYNCYAASFNCPVKTTCESILLVNLDSDVTIYEKNSHTRRSPASTTKIMTYIIVSEQIDDLEGTTVTITKDIINELSGTGSSVAGLKEGDNISIYNLLQCLMISSGNDAALALAKYVGNGNINSFVEMMNNKAIELGCLDTHFVNPHGLYEPEHYTTSSDLYKITKYAMSLPYFSEIVNTVVAYPFGENRYPIVTTNSLIDKVRGGEYYYRYAKGIKTGHLDESGYCLVSSATKNGHTYICVALGAPSIDKNGDQITLNGAMKDSKELYVWAFDSFTIKKILDSNTPVTEVKIRYSWDTDTLLLVPSSNFSTILPKNVEASSVEITPSIPEFVNATVKEGDKIGTATLRYANQDLATIDLVASKTVNRNITLYIISMIKNIITSKWFIISMVIVLILTILYIMLTTLYNKKLKASKYKYK